MNSSVKHETRFKGRLFGIEERRLPDEEQTQKSNISNGLKFQHRKNSFNKL